MKKIVFILMLIVLGLSINSCTIFRAFSVIGVGSAIDKSVLSAENEKFQEEAGLKLIVVKRGLWSMQDAFRNKKITLYYESLLDNRLEYSIDNTQEEFAKQIVSDNEIKISININIFQAYSAYEKAILLIASTSTLALLQDTSYNKQQIPNTFFNFIDTYDLSEVPDITASAWYKQKSVTINDSGIIINP
jgi:hypothetical protein